MEIEMLARTLEEVRDLTDKLEARLVHTGGVGEDQERRDRLTMGVVGLEGRQGLLGDTADVGRPPLQDVDAGEVEGGERGVVVEPEVAEGVPDLAEGRL